MKYFCALFFLLSANTLMASPAKVCLYMNSVAAVKDTDTVIRKQSASVGISYGSDVQFFGRTGPITYPFMSADAIYNTKSGFFLYTSAYKVLGYNPLIDEIDLGGGYLYNYSKNFTGTASYTRFFFNKDAAQVIKSASSNDLDWKNSYNWQFLKTSVVLDYLFGEESDIFVTLNASKYFETSWSIFDDKDYLSFNPTVSAIMGTQNFVQKYSLDYQYRMDQYNIFNHGPGFINHDNGKFNTLNYSFRIPVAYNRPHYTLEFSYKYSIPVNVEGVLMNRKESFYNLTFYYVFY